MALHSRHKMALDLLGVQKPLSIRRVSVHREYTAVVFGESIVKKNNRNKGREKMSKHT